MAFVSEKPSEDGTQNTSNIIKLKLQSIEPLTGKDFILEFPTLDTEMVQVFIDEFAKTDETSLQLVLIDNASSHTTEKLKVAGNSDLGSKLYQNGEVISEGVKFK